MPIIELEEILPYEVEIQSLLFELNERLRHYNDQHRNVEAPIGANVYLDSDGFSASAQWLSRIATVSTTDATVTTIDTVPIVADRTYFLESHIVARRTGGSGGTADDGAAYMLHGAFNTVSGTVGSVGSSTKTYTAEDQAGWDVTHVISGTNVLIRVTGAVNNNVSWHSITRVQWVSL